MLDLDLDALGSVTTFTGSGRSRICYPIIVDGYDTSSLDPNDHHIIGRRADPFADGVTQEKVYLNPKDPTEGRDDPNSRRPPISAFEFPQYANAVKDGNVKAIMALADNPRVKTFTDIGGMVLASEIEETEKGLIAGWIYPLSRDAQDDKHKGVMGWATIRPRQRGGMDTESVRMSEAVLARNIDELKAAIRRLFDPNNHLGRPAMYLRGLSKNADGPTTVKMIGGDFKETRRMDMRDRKVGDQYVPITPEEFLADFMNSPLGQKLNVTSYGNTVIEVIPVTVFEYSHKALAEKKGLSPDAAFMIPPEGEGSGEGGATLGYAVSTIRLSAATKKGTDEFSHFVASRVMPTTGELYRLEDLPTNNYAPEVEPKFARFQKKAAAHHNPDNDIPEDLPI